MYLDIYVFPSTCLFINFLFSILVEVQNRREGKNGKKTSKLFCITTNVSFLKYFQLWFFIPLHRCYNGFISIVKVSRDGGVGKNFTHGGTRTPNLRFRRPTPYPLGHAGSYGR